MCIRDRSTPSPPPLPSPHQSRCPLCLPSPTARWSSWRAGPPSGATVWRCMNCTPRLRQRFRRSTPRSSHRGQPQPTVDNGPGGGCDAAGGEIGLRARTAVKAHSSTGPGWRILAQIYQKRSTDRLDCIQATPALRGPGHYHAFHRGRRPKKAACTNRSNSL